MKKLLIILFIGLTSFLKAQTYTNDSVCQIQVNIYVNNQVLDTVYHFELHNDKLDIHFVNTAESSVNWFLDYGQEYRFIYAYNNKMKSIIIKTSPKINNKQFIVNFNYEPTIR